MAQWGGTYPLLVASFRLEPTSQCSSSRIPAEERNWREVTTYGLCSAWDVPVLNFSVNITSKQTNRSSGTLNSKSLIWHSNIDLALCLVWTQNHWKIWCYWLFMLTCSAEEVFIPLKISSFIFPNLKLEFEQLVQYQLIFRSK